MEVDTVIATHELIELFEKLKVDFSKIKVETDEKMQIEVQKEENKEIDLIGEILRKASDG